MAASAGTTDASAEILEELGLVAQHSYGLLKAAEAVDRDGNTIRLVLLRNPWGDFEWNGDWSDNSKLWTNEIKRQVGYDDSEGLFWMAYTDVCHFFSRIQFGHINDEYHYSFMKASHQRGSYTLMRLLVPGDGEHTISVAQTDERCFSRNSDYDYSNCRIIVLKIERDADTIKDLQLTYVNGMSGWDRDSHIEFENLPRGEYYVYIEMDWAEKTEDTEFCVTCYGYSKTFFLRDEKSLFDKVGLLRLAYASKATQQLEGVTCVNYADKNAPLINKYKCFNDEGYGFIYIKNDEKESSFKEKVQYTKFEGLEMMKPQQGQGYEILVKPGETKMILIKCSPEGYGMSASTLTSIVQGGKKLKELCLTQGKKTARPDPDSGEANEIYQYSYQHSEGICYLYVNESQNLTLDEEIEFQLTGLEIEGAPGETKVAFELGPGQQKFIKLKAISTPWKIATGIGYAIY